MGAAIIFTLVISAIICIITAKGLMNTLKETGVPRYKGLIMGTLTGFFLAAGFVTFVIISEEAEASPTVITETPPPFVEEQTISEDVIKEAKVFCATNGYSTRFCLLVDMSIHSGKNRMFIYDFKTESIVHKGLCAHGCCDNPWGEDSTKLNPRFSNVSESHCSSIGKYKIGNRGYSNWGININYRLHGLESTNKSANARDIVLHSWDMVEDQETYPIGAPEGWGCPAVTDNLMVQIDNLLKGSDESVLLWIYK